jgi:HK97 family phage major capsid protein
MTRNLLLQSTPAIEGLVRMDLAAAVATAIDKACLYGTGADGQPKGISLQTGINAPTAFAAAVPTWAEVVAMESAVAVDNALQGRLGYALEPAMCGSLKTKPKETGYPSYIMESNDRLNGHCAAVSSQIVSGDLFFGNWADLIVGFWGGLDLLVDPYTLGLSGGIRIIVHQSCDVGVRHPVSFAFNNDTA